MASISLSLSFQVKDGRFSLCATVKGTSKRNYKEVQGLINPNFDSWDKKSQRFNEPTNEAIHNNEVLRIMKEQYQYLIDMFKPLTSKELFAIYETASKVQAKKELTLGEYVKMVIQELKNPVKLKPSKNYQLYISLLSALVKEGNLINIPISEIDNNSFKQFGKWINNRVMPNGKGNNYRGLMKNFSAVINRAKEDELTSVTLSYKYKDDAPKKDIVFTDAENFAENFVEQGGNVKSLTEEQCNKFWKMDLSKIKSPIRETAKGRKKLFQEDRKELYRDVCRLIYELNGRPADIVALRYKKHIAYSEYHKCNVYVYFPQKKKNQANTPTTTKVTPDAQKIMDKYKGKSIENYVLPLPMNNQKWDVENDYKQFEEHNNKASKFKEEVNYFLHEIGKKLHLPFTLTSYAFRRSTITHNVVKGDVIKEVAQTAGTSPEMVNNHYLNKLHAAS